MVIENPTPAEENVVKVERKTKLLQIRVKESNLEKIKDHAKKLGKDVSVFILDLVFENINGTGVHVITRKNSVSSNTNMKERIIHDKLDLGERFRVGFISLVSAFNFAMNDKIIQDKIKKYFSKSPETRKSFGEIKGLITKLKKGI